MPNNFRRGAEWRQFKDVRLVGAKDTLEEVNKKFLKLFKQTHSRTIKFD